MSFYQLSSHFYMLSHAVTILQNENGPAAFCPFSRSHSCIPAYQRLHMPRSCEFLYVVSTLRYHNSNITLPLLISFCSFITFSSSHKIRPTHSITSRNSANTSNYIQKHIVNPRYPRQLQSANQLLASIPNHPRNLPTKNAPSADEVERPFRLEKDASTSSSIGLLFHIGIGQCPPSP